MYCLLYLLIELMHLLSEIFAVSRLLRKIAKLHPIVSKIITVTIMYF